MNLNRHLIEEIQLLKFIINQGNESKTTIRYCFTITKLVEDLKNIKCWTERVSTWTVAQVLLLYTVGKSVSEYDPFGKQCVIL
jgi:CRISPR/Cas system CSM-associated protein Csm2 small subunit